jgi:hypothetical protein
LEVGRNLYVALHLVGQVLTGGRAHLIQDLQPYTCTAPVCSKGDNKLLNTWEEWILHEQVYHRMQYTCPYHPEQVFAIKESFSNHIRQQHVETQDALSTLNEIDKNAQLASRPQSGCPLCSYEPETWADMDKHLAYHLESLALLSLPLATGLEKDDVHMESLQLEGSDYDAMQLLDGNRTETDDGENVSMHGDNGTTPHNDIAQENTTSDLETYVDWDGIRTREDTLPESDDFLQGLISSGAFQSRPSVSKVTK